MNDKEKISPLDYRSSQPKRFKWVDFGLTVAWLSLPCLILSGLGILLAFCSLILGAVNIRLTEHATVQRRKAIQTVIISLISMLIGGTCTAFFIYSLDRAENLAARAGRAATAATATAPAPPLITTAPSTATTPPALSP